jgi:hypothetical protein
VTSFHTYKCKDLIPQHGTISAALATNERRGETPILARIPVSFSHVSTVAECDMKEEEETVL